MADVIDEYKKHGLQAQSYQKYKRKKLLAKRNSLSEMKWIYDHDPVNIMTRQNNIKIVPNMSAGILDSSDPIGEFFVGARVLDIPFKFALGKLNYIRNLRGIRLANNHINNSNTRSITGLLSNEKEAEIAQYANQQLNPTEQVQHRLTQSRRQYLKSNSLHYQEEPYDIYEEVSSNDARSLGDRVYSKYKDVHEDAGLLANSVESIVNDIEGNAANIRHTPIIIMSKSLKENISPWQYRTLLEHEKSHARIIPRTSSEFQPRSNLDYWLQDNGTEQMARGTQIKNYFNKDVITGDELKYAAEHYIEDTGLDNNMSEFFNDILIQSQTDQTIWDKMARWISEFSPIGVLTINYGTKDNKKE